MTDRPINITVTITHENPLIAGSHAVDLTTKEALNLFLGPAVRALNGKAGKALRSEDPARWEDLDAIAENFHVATEDAWREGDPL